MKRTIIKDLAAWKDKTSRKPLILRGVRQVGKTYLLEQFGKTHFPACHIINFEKQERARRLFDGDLEPRELIENLKFLLKDTIDIDHDLVIFDEIQACPNALTSLKYFCEDMPQLALCAAGSLLGLHLNDGSFPVGKVDLLHLHPMTYSEFLTGINDEIAINYLDKIPSTLNISATAHDYLYQRLLQYFITGGLPEAINEFAQHSSLLEATLATRNKQKVLVKNYYSDIAKHSGKVNAMHIDRTWHAVSRQLAHSIDGSASRFKFKDILPNIKRYSQLVNVIDWLKSAELVIQTPLIEQAKLPLLAFRSDNLFKLFMFDIGILGSMLELQPETLLDNHYGNFKGYFTENFVAQQLIANDIEHIYNWQENRSEVEFLIQDKGRCIPIEVKSGLRFQAKSLEKFIKKYQPEHSIVLSPKPLKVSENGSPWFIPLYLADKCLEIVD